MSRAKYENRDSGRTYRMAVNLLEKCKLFATERDTLGVKSTINKFDELFPNDIFDVEIRKQMLRYLDTLENLDEVQNDINELLNELMDSDSATKH